MRFEVFPSVSSGLVRLKRFIVLERFGAFGIVLTCFGVFCSVLSVFKCFHCFFEFFWFLSAFECFGAF